MKTKTQTIAFAMIIAMLLPIKSIGQTLLDGKTIAENTYNRDEGISMSRKLIMKLKDKRGKVRVRETISLRKYFGKEKKLAIFYETPTSVKGTAFLTFDYPEASRDDDQWLYLPALRKTRRISAANRGDYFLGTDLTYEDIKLETRISKEDYNYTTIGKETIDGRETYVIEGIPKDKKIAKELGQSKVKVWVDAERWILMKAESWDVAGNFLKTVAIKDFKKVQNIWTYHTIHVLNHKTKHETEFILKDVVYNGDLRDDYFTEEALVNGL
jgi:outer membrane lipoprotein-sorting protein